MTHGSSGGASTRPNISKNKLSVSVNQEIHPDSEIGAFLQPQPPTILDSQRATVEQSFVVWRIEPTLGKRKREALAISILPHPKRARLEKRHPEPIEMPAPQPAERETHLSNQTEVVQHDYPRDELDGLIDQASALFERAPTWEQFASSLRGDISEFHPKVGQLPHPAAPILEELHQVGAPVMLATPEWSEGQRRSALERGPHKSAKEHIGFLRQEFTDMIHKGQWTILPARLVDGTVGFRLSPLGVVPQRERRPRTICDYTYFDLNDDTVPMAPQEAMQFGRALQRILQTIYYANPRLGPVYLSKIDIADGFYRIWVKAEDIPKLAVSFPSRPGEEPLVAFPLTLPMGWRESPPWFCTATETVADLANEALRRVLDQLPHRLDELAETQPQPDPLAAQAPEPDFAAPQTGEHYHKPVQYWDVYVDDFIGLAQGNRWRRRDIKRALLHTLDSVFRGLSPTDNPHRQEPASVKKLLKGDATWATRKVVLGWVIDTVRSTLELPAHRVERAQEILASIQPNQRRVAISTWHKVLGELRSMALAIPGGRGLFSTLATAQTRARLPRRLEVAGKQHILQTDLNCRASAQPQATHDWRLRRFRRRNGRSTFPTRRAWQATLHIVARPISSAGHKRPRLVHQSPWQPHQ